MRHDPAGEFSRFVVCGAGAGGLAVAARLGRKFGQGSVTVVDPAEVNVLLCSHCCAATPTHLLLL